MERVIVGIDPGLANTGYGLISFERNRFKIISYGTIKTDSNIFHGERLMLIYNELVEILKKYKPNEAGIESLYFAKNVTSALSVSEARGVSILALYLNGIKDIGEYAPNAIKKAVTGIASATKEQVQDGVKLLLGLSSRPRPDHAADALAVAIAKANIGVGYV